MCSLYWRGSGLFSMACHCVGEKFHLTTAQVMPQKSRDKSYLFDAGSLPVSALGGHAIWSYKGLQRRQPGKQHFGITLIRLQV